jgi:P-type Ca2+ transporter type 2C
MRKITVREAWTIGIGLDPRLTTEIIVARLLYDAKLIGGHLFATLVLAAAFTEVTVPLLFAIVVSRWSEQLRT